MELQVVSGTTHALRDVEEMLGLVASLGPRGTTSSSAPRLSSTPRLSPTFAAELRSLFDFDFARPFIVTRSPGRMDVIGGIADYSGSLVLEMPIAEAVVVVLQRRADRRIRCASIKDDGGAVATAAYTWEGSLDDLVGSDGAPIAYAASHALFAGKREWAGYVVGTLLVLMREKGLRLDDGMGGFNILMRSQVPVGKGVSSSAAIEVATMNALLEECVASGCTMAAGSTGAGVVDGVQVAVLCQMAENHVCGAPCGLMDQMTVSMGKKDELLALLCQPDTLLGTIAIPLHIKFWAIDCGVRHALSHNGEKPGADYGSVRTGAFMGKTMLGVSRDAYLVDVAPSTLMALDAQSKSAAQPGATHLPAAVRGAAFAAAHGDHGDTVTAVAPRTTYAIDAPTAHPIGEHFRVRLFRSLLAAKPSAEQLELLGELMYQAHSSYSLCGIGSDGTDALVQLVKDRAAEEGNSSGLYGAKITGGGSGGSVCVLGTNTAQAEASVRAIAAEYKRRTGLEPYIFAGSSLGADQFGRLKVRFGGAASSRL